MDRNWVWLAGLMLAAIGGPGPGQEQTNVVTSIQEVFKSSNPAALQGRRAEWTDVQVQRVLNSQVLLVGTKDHQVVVRREDTRPELHPGQHVDINGILNPMPATTQAWDMPGKDLQLLRNHAIFLNALKLKVRPESQTSPRTGTH